MQAIILVGFLKLPHPFCPPGSLPLAPKWTHLAWQVIAFLLSIVATVNIFLTKGTVYSHMYSVHAYVGMAVLVLYYLQVRVQLSVIAMPYYLQVRVRGCQADGVAE